MKHVWVVKMVVVNAAITVWYRQQSNLLNNRLGVAAVQGQKAAYAYFTSKQILPSGFAKRRGCIPEWRTARNDCLQITLSQRWPDVENTY